MKTLKIKKYKYEKVIDGEATIDIPDEILYVFQTGIRRSIRLVPLFLKDQLVELRATCVHLSFENKIVYFKVPVDERSLENVKWGNDSNIDSSTSILQMLQSKDYELRTKKQFESDLKYALGVIEDNSKILKYY